MGKIHLRKVIFRSSYIVLIKNLIRKNIQHETKVFTVKKSPNSKCISNSHPKKQGKISCSHKRYLKLAS